MQIEIGDSIRIMKALADSSRLMILNALFDRAQYVEELAERLNLSASTVSFHLKKLAQAKLVVKRKKQYYAEFDINRELFSRSLQELTSFENVDKFVQKERLDRYRQKVLRSFFPDGRLVKMPAQVKKKHIVLDEISKRFKPGKIYSEAEVNEAITPLFDDYCLLRRELIEFGYMKRDGHSYQLLLKNKQDQPHDGTQ